MVVTCMSHAGPPEGGRGAGCTPLPSDEGPSCSQQAHLSGGGGAHGAQTEVKGCHDASTSSYVMTAYSLLMCVH